MRDTLYIHLKSAEFGKLGNFSVIYIYLGLQIDDNNMQGTCMLNTNLTLVYMTKNT